MRKAHHPPMESFPPFFFFIILSSILLTSKAISTIGANIAIKDGDNDTIISDDQNFQLGFFSPSATSRNKYLGKWYYKKVKTRTVVWVANRQTPLIDALGVLVLNGNWTLMPLNGKNSTLWSSNSTSTQVNPVAQLLDIGNLVIRNEIDGEPQDYLWQCFYYPSDTFLPRMKFGIDFVRGINKHLTSWKNAEDPSPGDYTDGFDSSGYPQILVKKDSQVQYSSGPRNGLRFSSQNLKPNSLYTYEFVLNERELLYKYELVNSSVLTRMILNPSGTVQRFIWVEQTQEWVLYVTIQTHSCDRYGLCGTNGVCNINDYPACGCLPEFEPKLPEEWSRADWSNGCVRKTRINCEGGDGFMKHSGIKLPDTRKTWFNTSTNLEECEIKYLRNCNCTAYANTDIRGGGSGCLLWFNDLINIRAFSENGQDTHT